MTTAIMSIDPLAQLRKSRFRRSFGLSEFEKNQIRQQGILELIDSCEEIIHNKLDHPIQDGKQTPYRGHPVFKAMHATACCCRKCLFKWHRIPPREELTEKQVRYIQDIIYRWTKKQMYR